MSTEMVEFGDVVKVDRTTASDDACQTLPFVGLEHIEKDTGAFVPEYRPVPESLLATKFRFTPEHVLYGKLRPNLNKVVLPRFDGVCTTEILPLIPKNGAIDTTYLYFLLQSPHFVAWATHSVSGANLPRLDPKTLEEFSFFLPPIGDQEKFAAALLGAQTLNRMRRYALEMGDELLPAAFLEMFVPPPDRWPRVKIEELAINKPNAIRTGPFGSQLLHSEFTSSGIAVLGIDNAVNNRFDWDQRRYISLVKYQQLKRYTVLPGDVIITIMGTCGRCAVIPDNIPTAINTKHLCCITLDQEKALPAFIHAAFLYHPHIHHQLAAAEKGAIMEGLNMGIIKELSLPLPPVPLQQKFANLVGRHERLRATNAEALRQADHLFQTLLHEAFAAQ
jgi:type I restriction enzyme, S subunit